MILKKHLYIPKIILAGLIGIFLVVDLALLAINRLYPNMAVDRTTYQAVFLDNNQVYFGHLKNERSAHPVLSDVYYVRLNSSPQDSQSGQLVKLGAEAHGPQNEMILNNFHVLFWENLRPDSQIIRTIQTLSIQK